MIAGKRSITNAMPPFEVTDQDDVPQKLLAKVQKKMKQLKISIPESVSLELAETTINLSGYHIMDFSSFVKSITGGADGKYSVGTGLNARGGDKSLDKLVKKGLLRSKKGKEKYSDDLYDVNYLLTQKGADVADALINQGKLVGWKGKK
jgi:hypothetical protein